MSGTLARLKRRADFLSVAAARRKWVAPGLIVQAHRRANTG
ncbi:MAG: ribonuclease P protein component, partial [Alphaproteobacteria bacterium]|nr:ribonuclease P protein component [Alphaproteobacteria bacterium]